MLDENSNLDSYRHKGMRRQLIEQIRQKGITSESVLDAMGRVPRHLFLEKAFLDIAYEDKPFPIGDEQTISQPYTVAYQTSLLELKPKDKVLEIGTGSGYQAAVLAATGVRVFTIERYLSLHQKSKAIFELLGYSKAIRAFHGDGWVGLAEYAPFDKILVTCGASQIPEALTRQLRIGGHLVVPVGNEVQKMYKITRLSETEFKTEVFDNFKFVPFLRGTEQGRINR